MEQIINAGANTLNIETQLREYNKNIEDLKNKVQELEKNKKESDRKIHSLILGSEDYDNFISKHQNQLLFLPEELSELKNGLEEKIEACLIKNNETNIKTYENIAVFNKDLRELNSSLGKLEEKINRNVERLQNYINSQIELIYELLSKRK